MDVKDVTKMTEAEIDAEVKRQQLIQARLTTERLTAENSRAIQAKAAGLRKRDAMQAQLRGQARAKYRMRTECNHRQGWTPKKRYTGNGTTALKIAKMPDGITTKIHCMTCSAEWWSPLQTNQSPKPKHLAKLGRLETKAEVEARVKKYMADKTAFEEVLAMAEDGITEELTTPMDPGVKMRVTDADGLPVYRPRPCDSYATGAHVTERELTTA